MATTPANLPLTIVKGISYGPVIFNFKQENGDPFDLTNGGTWGVFAHARKTKDAKDLINLNPQITDGVNGEVTIQLTHEQTALLLGGEFGWDLLLESPDGTRLGPYFEGKLKVKEIYTHI